MCVAALVMGCLGWASLLGMVTSVLAIVFGTIGTGNCRRDPTLQGRGMGTAGIVLGCIFLGFWLLMSSSWEPSSAPSSAA